MRKFYLITMAILLLTVSSAHTPKVTAPSDRSTETIDDCPEPNINKFSYFCNAIKDRRALKTPIRDLRYEYEIKMWEMSCADPYSDYVGGLKKVREMLAKYLKDKCTCQTGSLSQPISILKYAIYAGYAAFVMDLIDLYGVNIDFKDPVDGKSVFQYLDDEYVIALKEDKPGKAKELKKIKEILVELQNEQKSKN